VKRWLLILFIGLTACGARHYAPGIKKSNIVSGLIGKLVVGNVVIDLRTGEEIWGTPARSDGDDKDGHLSPDGKTVLFQYERETADGRKVTEIRTVDVNGANERTWLTAKQLRRRVGWSPDGKFIYVEHDGFLIVHVESGEAWRMKVPDGWGAPLEHAWSNDGKHLFYAKGLSREWGSDIAIMKTDLKLENPEQIYTGPGVNFSPDETMFYREQGGSLYVTPVGEKKWTEVTRVRGFLTAAFWSPDSKWAGYEAMDYYNNSKGFYAVNVGTRKRVRLPIVYGPFVSWWQPPAGPLPDCEKIVRETLGPGRPLKELLADISPSGIPKAEGRK
jgi:hypothetical protein